MDEPMIYNAAGARALREAATPGPWRRDGLEVVPAHIGLEGWLIADCGHADSPDSAPCNADLIAASPDLAASVEYHASTADRLAKLLLVERGHRSHARPGWEPRGADMWVRVGGPGRVVIQRHQQPGEMTLWVRRGEIDGPCWDTALEAMEDIDGVRHG